MSEKDTSNSFAFGVIVGAAIGLAIGFLYAPRPGEETRQILIKNMGKVEEKAAEVARTVKEATAKAREQAEAKFEEIKKQTG